MTELLRVAVPLVTAGAMLSAAVVYAATRRLRPTLAVLLDLLTAAGLLRLAAAPAWSDIALAATVIAVRRLLSTGLRASEAAAATAGTAGPHRRE